MKYLMIAVTLLLPLTTSAASTLTAAEIEKLKKGEEITKVEEIKGEVFPRVTLISLIPHTPHENMRTFTQFEKHNKFIPNLVKSKVVHQEGNIVDVAFEMDMPIVKNTKYTTRHTVVYEEKDAVLTWDLLKSDQLKRTRGMVKFEELEGKTLFTYVSHITPDSSLAWTVKSRVVPDVKRTIEAVKEYLARNAGN